MPQAEFFILAQRHLDIWNSPTTSPALVSARLVRRFLRTSAWGTSTVRYLHARRRRIGPEEHQDIEGSWGRHQETRVSLYRWRGFLYEPRGAVRARSSSRFGP
eukprot:7550958-Pyramimonas_sp.AAC.1